MSSERPSKRLKASLPDTQSGDANAPSDDIPTSTVLDVQDSQVSLSVGQRKDEDAEDGDQEDSVVDQHQDEVSRPVEEKATRQDKFVPQHGNYRGYYSKRRALVDPYAGDARLALIPKEWLRDKRVLDVGCNAGKVTIEIAQHFRPFRVTGVDIDADLIKTAHALARRSWSTQEPLPSIRAAAQKNRERSHFRRRSVSRSPSPVESSEVYLPAADHFPTALSWMYGYLPQVPSDKLLRMYVKPTREEALERSRRKDGSVSRHASVMPKEIALFPHNLHFKHADWVNDEIKSDRKGYDCILAFSVSKWIHLNGGDDGLLEFFARVFRTLLPSGRFILEPQPWSSYEKARKLTAELKESYHALKLRPDDFERILLQDIGFKSVEKLSETDEGGFKRPLHVYHKAAGSWL